jgi:hypothetical protein
LDLSTCCLLRWQSDKRSRLGNEDGGHSLRRMCASSAHS